MTSAPSSRITVIGSSGRTRMARRRRVGAGWPRVHARPM
jgi:hypothetical protein